MRKFLLSSVLCLLILAGVITGAAAQDEGTEAPESSDTAYIRIAHFVREGEAVDAYLDGEQLGIEPLIFAMVTEWVAVPQGSHALTIVPSDGELSDALLEVELAVLPEEFTTFVITASDEAESGLITLEVVENFDEMLPGTGRVTFLNAMSDGSIVNFNLDGIAYVTSLGAIGDVADGRDAYVSIPMDAREYDFTVNVTGQTDNLSELLDSAIRDDEVYLLLVLGTAASPTLIIYETTSAQAELVRGNLIAPGTVVEAAQSYDMLLPFYDVLVQAELEEILSLEGPYTLFIPADYLLEDFGDRFTDDIGPLQTILGHHVVRGDYKFSDLVALGDGATLTTITEQTLVIGFSESSLTINGVEIIVENIPATNGTIHVINNILSFGDAEEPLAKTGTAADVTAEPPDAVGVTETPVATDTGTPMPTDGDTTPEVTPAVTEAPSGED